MKDELAMVTHLILKTCRVGEMHTKKLPAGNLNLYSIKKLVRRRKVLKSSRLDQQTNRHKTKT